MLRTIRGTYREGAIHPDERLALPEGTRLTVTMTSADDTSPAEASEAFARAAGGWRELVDHEALKARLYAARVHGSRTPGRPR